MYVKFQCMGEESVNVCESPPSPTAGAIVNGVDPAAVGDAAAGNATEPAKKGKIDLAIDGSYNKDELEPTPWYKKPWILMFIISLLFCLGVFVILFVLAPPPENQNQQQNQGT